MTECKTNVMRILDKHNLNYLSHDYTKTDAINGVDVANALNENPMQVFKTIVTVSKSKKYYVFMLPVSRELDFKKCALAVNEKSIEMLKMKELLPLTGYVHGGCSPIGMKKYFPTIIDKSAKNFDSIIFSAGKIGYQVECNVNDLQKVIKFNFADIIEN